MVLFSKRAVFSTNFCLFGEKVSEDFEAPGVIVSVLAKIRSMGLGCVPV